ncbi:hypothetical protein [Novosphingobium terrae]|uniref:hypothetical protein n=1 Tax=Novosphingobium terrae TaxID=2726189 RepID=UPI00197E3493|nr:hypothetical protein [Novosphingobium terrae]
MRKTSASPFRFLLRGAACLTPLALSMALLAGPGRARDNAHLQEAALGTQSDVMLESSLFVEHIRQNARGPVHMLEPARQVNSGDKVVTLLSWYRLGGTGGFTVTDAVPGGMSYQPGEKDEAEVSADGGKTWGRLGALRVGHRLATAQDVTHMRWHITPAQALAGSGRIAYAGMVR